MDTEAILLIIILILTAIIVTVLFCQNKNGERAKAEESQLLCKLTSRKLWVALGAFITTMSVTWGINDVTTEQLTGTCVAVSSLLAYIGAEGYADGHSPTNKSDDIIEDDTT